MIYRVLVKHFDEYDDEVVYAVNELLFDICVWHYEPQENEFTSDHVSAPVLAKIEPILKSHGIEYELVDESEDYLHVVTSAPQAYDYPYTLSLGQEGLDARGKVERHVAVQKERQDFQFGRYQSGFCAYRIVG